MKLRLLEIMLLGIFLRVGHFILFDPTLPHGYGGLFYAFAGAIRDAGYTLPDRIPYYSPGGLPYAYPPLAFYLEAVLLDLLHPAHPYFLVNVLPVLLSCLSLPAFYLLAREVFDEPGPRLLAMFAFAALPAGFIQMLEAGGLAEGVGMIVVIGYVAALLRLLRTQRIQDAVLAGLLMGLCVLSSPGSAYAALLLAAPTLILLRNGRGIALLLLTGLIGSAVASPYVWTVIERHGIDQFTSPFGSQHYNPVVRMLLRFLDFNPGGSPFARHWDALIALGLLGAVLTRRNILWIWFVLLFWIPAEGVWLVAVPASLVIAVGIHELLIPAIQSVARRPPVGYQLAGIGLMFFYVFVADVFIISAPVTHPDAQMDLRHLAALEWIDENLPADVHLIVLAPLTVVEWTPVVAQREVLNVRFGTEWEPDEYRLITDFNEEVELCESLPCVWQQAAVFGEPPAMFAMIDFIEYPDLSISGMVSVFSQGNIVIVRLADDSSQLHRSLFWKPSPLSPKITVTPHAAQEPR